ncbi:hypothetical protein PV04_04019 [Phialophora macrospora]|uniref:Uncharacterized protein n=1 Tax=Phialophora macrospora TaxID=1851006 RepID=A0A0D2G837_9EURO|nr:hypothetical protein PV04_04019 [Phialophora macrospora]
MVDILLRRQAPLGICRWLVDAMGVVSPSLVVNVFFGSQCSIQCSISSFYEPVVSSRHSRKSCSDAKIETMGRNNSPSARASIGEAPGRAKPRGARIPMQAANTKKRIVPGVESGVAESLEWKWCGISGDRKTFE